MDMPYWKAALLGVVEGLTEFLPISSTGHLILAAALLDFNDAKGQVFQLVIQTGAMLAVMWEFRVRFRDVLAGLGRDPQANRFALKIAVAFTPAALLGLVFGKYIKAMLFKPVPVAIAFIVGGVIILWAERRAHRVRCESVDEMSVADAFKVGLAQAVALIPGMSRSGATIIGGLCFGLSRRAATEFSFFLAVPTLLAAGGYDLLKHRALFAWSDVGAFGVGLVVSFVAAFACIRWLLRYVMRHDFTPFAWYRIVFGVVVLLTAHTGVVNWAVG